MEFEKTITPSAESIKIANRLKELRSKKELSFEQLKKVLFEEYNIKISVDSLKNYEITEDHIRANSNLGMRIEYLNCFADFYGVTADYLLGRTDDPSPKPSIADELGLSERTVENLKELHQDTEHIQNRVEALNVLLSSYGLEHLLDDINQYLVLAHSYRDLQEENARITQQYVPDNRELRRSPAVVKYLPSDIQPIYQQNFSKLKNIKEESKYRLFCLYNTLSRMMENHSHAILFTSKKRK